MIDKVESTSDLRTLATKVLEGYGIVPEELSVIQGGSIKTVWKFKYKNQILCLKRLRQTLDKVLFSANAQIYIKNAGGNVPKIILDKKGEPIVIYSDQIFIVYEWLNGKDLIFNNPEQLKLAIEGLAKFHISSKGYIAKEGARVSTKLGKLSNQYNSMKNKMIAWKDVALSFSSPQYAAYLNCVDSVIELADLAENLLKESKYNELISETSPAPVLCHQDYGTGNAVLTDEGVFVIDLDSVTFDLPTRDLRKIIGKMCQNHNGWNKKTIEDIVSWYTNVNSMTSDEKKVLYIDLLFPHWFFGLVKNQYIKNKDITAAEIEKSARFEVSKLSVINELLER